MTTNNEWEVIRILVECMCGRTTMQQCEYSTYHDKKDPDDTNTIIRTFTCKRECGMFE